jgi:hypothetical protein
MSPNTTRSELSATDDRSSDPDALLPETVQLTAATIRRWRKAGYRVSEERAAPWLYLRARSSRESALYKVIGPDFQGSTAAYRGIRIA